MDPVSLAVIAAGVLPKALPYLLKLGGAMGDSLAKEAGEKFGPEAWETAKRIWSKIGGRLQGRPAGMEAVDDVEKTPDNEDTRAALRNQIKKILEEDPSLTAELAKVVDDRIKVDMTLGDIVKATVIGVDIEGEAASADVHMKAGDVKEGSTVIGYRAKKIP